MTIETQHPEVIALQVEKFEPFDDAANKIFINTETTNALFIRCVESDEKRNLGNVDLTDSNFDNGRTVTTVAICAKDVKRIKGVFGDSVSFYDEVFMYGLRLALQTLKKQKINFDTVFIDYFGPGYNIENFTYKILNLFEDYRYCTDATFIYNNPLKSEKESIYKLCTDGKDKSKKKKKDKKKKK